MTMDCEMLGSLLSERRRGELSAEQGRALDAHLAVCARCREEARGLESLLAALELPPVTIAELEALRSRRIGETLPRMPRSRAWQVPAVLVAAAAAAVLTVSVRPGPHHRISPVGQQGGAVFAPEALAASDSQELFPEMSAEAADETPDSLEEDALSLEGPGLFGNLDG